MVEVIDKIRNLRDAGEFVQAEELALASIEGIVSLCGENSLEMAALWNELGIIGKYSGEFSEAEEYYQKALCIHESRGEALSANIASVLHNLAGLEHARGAPESAVEIALQGIDVRLKVEAADSVSLLEDLAAFVAILIDLDNFREARIIADAILWRYREIYGDCHIEVATALHNLGSLQYREGNFVDAASTLRDSMEMKSCLLGGRHPDLAITMYNLARCEEKRGESETAVSLCRNAASILEGVVSSDHPVLVACQQLAYQLMRASRIGA
ncbi:tetratricopeptide repeat protein [Streptomyces sp. NPDC051909]|uniref:tetratricopeptide repeat protein n=1 Tax=Streptomyces sp. NPDC051909 TaxID=3154944 RepID=UPI00342AB076